MINFEFDHVFPYMANQFMHLAADTDSETLPIKSQPDILELLFKVRSTCTVPELFSKVSLPSMLIYFPRSKVASASESCLRWTRALRIASQAFTACVNHACGNGLGSWTSAAAIMILMDCDLG